jgi:hypothetical protein
MKANDRNVVIPMAERLADYGVRPVESLRR